jgi:hypothetical protein|tara:strand:+ start:399 stop:632 length:234 start_codon:yes stop_codon:yes gene_type:complete
MPTVTEVRNESAALRERLEKFATDLRAIVKSVEHITQGLSTKVDDVIAADTPEEDLAAMRSAIQDLEAEFNKISPKG